MIKAARSCEKCSSSLAWATRSDRALFAVTPLFVVPLPVAASVGGGKAASLALLAGCKVDVPRGFVCTDVLFRNWVGQACGSRTGDTDEDLLQLRNVIAEAAFPQGFAEELAEGLLLLGADFFAIRSSFALEDEADALAAGVFESVLKVKTGDVLQAIRKVLLSAISPAAVAYVRARGRNVLDGPMGVLVHGFVVGTAHGHVAATHDAVLLWVNKGQVTAEVQAELEQTALQVSKQCGPSELEWVCQNHRPTFLQWRPYTPAPPARPWQPTQLDQYQSVAAPTDDWIWDAAHNPAPLSPAQQGLVELVNERCHVGYDQRVVGGYLFYRKNVARSPLPVPTADVDECYLQLESQVLTDLAGLSQVADLPAALAVFVRHYEAIVGVLGGAVRAGKKQLAEFVEQHAPDVLPRVAALVALGSSKAEERRQAYGRVALATGSQIEAAWHAYIDAFGDEPVAWDVMSPTQRELPRPSVVVRDPSPRMVEDNAVRAAIVEAFDPSLRSQLEGLLLTAARCSVRGEDDDWLYARLQAPVRFALKDIGRRWRSQGLLESEDDVFFLPLTLVSQLSFVPATPALPLADLVNKGKTLFEQQINNPPPVSGGKSSSQLRGHGTAGRVVGRVKFYKAGQRHIENECILVAKSLLPTELPLLSAAAFVVETGGPLDHVAAQARERRIPAVVGVMNATTLLYEGDLVMVDADAGVVVRLQRGG
jgi:phosphohistidine swiveling domain-containing protein